MKKLPIAKFILEENLLSVDSSVFKEGHYFAIEQAMIEFAKLHVTAALKATSNNVEVTTVGDGSSSFSINGEPLFSVNGSPLFSTTSIINSYPLENIK